MPERKTRAAIMPDAEFRSIWLRCKTIHEVMEATGYSHDSAVRRGSKLNLPRFTYVSPAVTHAIQVERWQWQSSKTMLTPAQINHAAYAAGVMDAGGDFDTIRSLGKILGHRMTVSGSKKLEPTFNLLAETYGGDVAPPLIGPGVRSATKIAWTIETSALETLARATQHITMRWRDEMYAVVLFYKNSERG